MEYIGEVELRDWPVGDQVPTVYQMRNEGKDRERRRATETKRQRERETHTIIYRDAGKKGKIFMDFFSSSYIESFLDLIRV